MKRYSYNQMKELWGKNDDQVKRIKSHLDSLNPNKNPEADASNKTLEAFVRLTT